MANLGNAWHLPDNPEPPGEAGMRSPAQEIDAETTITIFSGNQFRGSGNAANQLQDGSELILRKSTDTDWTSVPLIFHRQVGNNKYFAAKIPAHGFHAGDIVQYYLKIAYSNRDLTFLKSAGFGSAATATEAEARATPFSFDVHHPILPLGSFLSIDQGPIQARIYGATGHIQIAGPDRGGLAHATVVSFAPPSTRLAGQPRSIGRVRTATPLLSGLQLEQDLDGRVITARLAFVDTGVLRYEVTDWAGAAPMATSLTAASNGQERFFGFGEKFDAFDQTGKVVRMETFDQPGNKGNRSYKVTPWFISTRGYGLHFDSTAESVFDMRTAETGRYSVFNPSSVCAFNIVFGPRLTDVLTRFTGYVGRPPLPPPFVFGPWISSDVWRTGGEVRYAVSKWRERKLPASVFVFDSPWETAYNDFTFNMQQFGKKGTFEGTEYDGFSSLDEMMTFLRQNGLKVVCWLTPFVNEVSRTQEVEGQLPKAGNYEDGRAQGVFVRGPDGQPLRIGWWKGVGSHIDFTRAEAKAWLQMQLRALVDASRVVTRSGRNEHVIGGFKTDDGEAHTNPDSPDTENGIYIRDDAVFADGRRGSEMRNAYCVEYHRAVWEVLGDDGVIFARSGFTGSQAFPGCWAGDNEPNFGGENGLPSVILAGLTSAMSGYSIWGHDIGGYLNHSFSTSPASLFSRWTQFGCFSPVMQTHRQVNLRDSNDLRHHPWGFARPGETPDNNVALSHFRFYAALHTRLFPYIYTYAQRASQTGLPIMRPLVLMHPDDSRTHTIRHTYYFGEEFLVAPVIQPDVTERDVYLPGGEWLDFWTNEIRVGGTEVRWKNADPVTFPLFVRQGAIIPMLSSEVDTLCDEDYVDNAVIRTPDNGLTFAIYPAGVSGFELYDGTRIVSRMDTRQMEITIESTSRPVQLRVVSPRPEVIRLDGKMLVEHASFGTFMSGDAGWIFQPEQQMLLVKFPHEGPKSRINW
jgi:alpha-D-xyloside xylohydrolase